MKNNKLISREAYEMKQLDQSLRFITGIILVGVLAVGALVWLSLWVMNIV